MPADQSSINEPAETSPVDAKSPPTGRWVVVGIFAFAIVIISAMWIYLDRHTAPFRPLRRALATQFENSAPKVEGGQTRMENNTPVTLRVVMRVEFNPNQDENAASEFATRVFNFSRDHHDLSKYQVFEIHLYYLDPEQKVEEWSANIDPATGAIIEINPRES